MRIDLRHTRHQLGACTTGLQCILQPIRLNHSNLWVFPHIIFINSDKTVANLSSVLRCYKIFINVFNYQPMAVFVYVAIWVVRSTPLDTVLFLVPASTQTKCNKGLGMCYAVCRMVHIKHPMMIIRKSTPKIGSSGFYLPLTEQSLNICPTPHNQK